jgi:uncharacterized protein (DUF302 family)
MDPVYERSVRGDIDEVGRRLEQAVQARSYGVLGRIDLQEKMKSKGVDFSHACRIYEVCNPIRAKHVLENDMSIATALPCRIALYESAGTLKLATLRPRAILSSFNRPELDEEASQVEEDLKAIIDDVATP